MQYQLYWDIRHYTVDITYHAAVVISYDEKRGIIDLAEKQSIAERTYQDCLFVAISVAVGGFAKAQHDPRQPLGKRFHGGTCGCLGLRALKKSMVSRL